MAMDYFNKAEVFRDRFFFALLAVESLFVIISRATLVSIIVFCITMLVGMSFTIKLKIKKGYSSSVIIIHVLWLLAIEILVLSLYKGVENIVPYIGYIRLAMVFIVMLIMLILSIIKVNNPINDRDN